MLLRDAIAIVGGVVEVVDAQLDRPRHHVPLFLRATPHHEPSVATTAKANFRDPQLGVAYLPILHGRLLLRPPPGPRPYQPMA